jgi:hypothetical protein
MNPQSPEARARERQRPEYRAWLRQRRAYCREQRRLRAVAVALVAAGRRALALRCHPDRPGGSEGQMVEVNAIADWLEGQAARHEFKIGRRQ